MIEDAASQSVPWLATGSNSTWMMPSRTLFFWGARRRGGGGRRVERGSLASCRAVRTLYPRVPRHGNLCVRRIPPASFSAFSVELYPIDVSASEKRRSSRVAQVAPTQRHPPPQNSCPPSPGPAGCQLCRVMCGASRCGDLDEDELDQGIQRLESTDRLGEQQQQQQH